MDIKKDIYEHLAEIYLDASNRKKKKTGFQPKFKNLFFIGIAIISAPTIVLFSAFNKAATSNPQSLILVPQTIKINPLFENGKYSVDLGRKDLSRYSKLVFSARQDDDGASALTLRIKLTSAAKEKSEIYLKPLSYKWSEFVIDLDEFKNISSWLKMLNLSFMVERPDKNQGEKNRDFAVYIDNIRFLR